MSKDGKPPPPMVPSLVVGVLRDKVRWLSARLAGLEPKSHGQAIEIEQRRAALGHHPDRCSAV